jgi:hypothetical protein
MWIVFIVVAAGLAAYAYFETNMNTGESASAPTPINQSSRSE